MREKLDAVKARRAPPQPGWYPWDSFGTVVLLDQLLAGRWRWLTPMIAGDPVVDIGCGDGALSFVFESLGFKVCAVDHRPSNYNEMRGVAALKEAMRSKVRVAEIDLDRNSRLPVKRCGLALFLGVLYHLKNPLGVLETIGEQARYCLLSTAVTRFAPGEGADLSAMPAAFLTGRDGLRGDETNYWIFTDAGLRNLIDRAGWEVCCWLPLRDEDSLLWGSQKDERILCLLRSRQFPPTPRSQLGYGWHVLENKAWRWTERRFSVVAGPGVTEIMLQVSVPPNLPVPLTLSGRVLDRPGDHDLVFPATEGEIEFTLDHALPPDARDGRERGIIVRAVATG